VDARAETADARREGGRVREGEVVRARLVAVHSYGLAIEAEGMPGFVQPVELSWDPNATPADVGEIGDELDVLVYAITPERFYGSLKQARADLDPWRDPERFRVGLIHRGEVTGILDWGMAVTIAPGRFTAAKSRALWTGAWRWPLPPESPGWSSRRGWRRRSK
jgi:ribosomal protein S1